MRKQTCHFRRIEVNTEASSDKAPGCSGLEMSINPIIPGFSPDPSVVLVNEHFFLVTSTFHLFPGLPIYVSKDLVHWKHIGNAFNRREQMSLAQSDTALWPQQNGNIMLATGGLYAPTIRYRDGTFFVICTNVIHPGRGSVDKTENFVLSTTDIFGGQWSDPVYFDFDGIDPSIFFDEDGIAYVTGSHAPGPWTKIHLFELDLQTGKKLTEETKIWDGTGGIYPEGPHIYKRDGMYYLLISEGGTHEDHMITVARSENIWGPYQACADNPILTARGTNEYIQYTGHCDMFDDAEGNAWGVCLGVRKDAEGRFNMGRETFLTPGRWQDGWPALDLVKPVPKGVKVSPSSASLTAEPFADLLHIRDADLSRYDITGSSITLTANDVDLSAPSASPTFVGRRQRRLDGTASATMHVSSDSSVKAGVACYKDEHRYVRIFFEGASGSIVFECRNNAKNIHRTTRQSLSSIGHVEITIEMKLVYSAKHYDLQFRTADAESWQTAGHCDTLELTGPDFVGPVIGVFAFGQGEAVKAAFTNFVVD